MFKKIQMSEIEQDGLLHSRIDKFTIIHDKKKLVFKINFIRLKTAGSFYNCTITVTDWWAFEVYEYNRLEKVRTFDTQNIPELNQILDFSFVNDELTFTGIGLHKNTAIDYKFTRPKIEITGEYDPD